MASFAPIRGTREQIQNTPLVDGQFLVETDQGDQNKTYIDAYNGQNVLVRTMCGGGGHQILPTPSSEEPAEGWEEAIVDAINSATSTSDDVASLFGIQKWTNTMTNRVVYSGSIARGAEGIGYFPTDVEYADFLEMSDAERLEIESATYDPSDPTNGWGWWYSDMFKMANLATDDNVDLTVLFDPLAGEEPLTLGSYILDTTNGYLCIKFGTPVTTATHKIAVDLTVLRTSV